MGFNNQKKASSNVTSRAALKPRLTEVVSAPVYEEYTQFHHDVTTLVTSAMEILAAMPNWLDTNALMKMDLGKLDLTEEGLLSILSEVIKLPQKVIPHGETAITRPRLQLWELPLQNLQRTQLEQPPVKPGTDATIKSCSLLPNGCHVRLIESEFSSPPVGSHADVSTSAVK